MTSHLTILICGALMGQTAPPQTGDVTALRSVAVQHDGRWPPLDTAARDLVESVTGDADFRGWDPLKTLLAWTFDPQTWMKEPLIHVGAAELREELKLSLTQTDFSYVELIRHEPLRALINDLAHVEEGSKLDPLQSKVSDINEKLGVLSTVFQNQALKFIPDPKDADAAWRPVGPDAHGHGASDPVAPAWTALGQAFLADDPRAFATASERFIAAVSSLPAAYRPDPARIAVEVRYNRLHPFRSAWRVMVAGAILAALALKVRRKGFDVLVLAALVAGFGLLTWGLSMRWQIAGRIPASNMYESLLFLSWGTGAFAILSMMLIRDRMVPLTASCMGALSLMLADVLPMDSFVRPIAPVLLDTVWMSIHVPIIMVSYSVLALAVLIAHAQLFVMALAPSRRPLIYKIDQLHYWYVHVGAILLGAGIITGSMWAASSWGRYWGWDPKEVWSLVAFLGYLTILHVRNPHERLPRWSYGLIVAGVAALLVIVAPKLAPITTLKGAALAATVLAMIFFIVARGEFATAVKSILAFWLIIMTYLGVNYVLGTGLHSYGFGAGAMTRTMVLLGGGDLLLVALLGVARLGARPVGAPGTPLPITG